MRKEVVNRMIAKYLDGKTSPGEEKRLALMLDDAIGRGDAPQEWHVVLQLLGELTLGEAIYDKVIAERRRRRIGLWTAAVVAASAALVLMYMFVPHADTSVGAERVVAKEEIPVQNVEEGEAEESVPMITEAKAVARPRKRVVYLVVDEVANTEQAESISETSLVACEEKYIEEMSGESVVPESTAAEDFLSESIPDTKDAAEEMRETEPVDIEELRRRYGREIAQVERRFYEWERRQTVVQSRIEADFTSQMMEGELREYGWKGSDKEI